MQCQGRLLIGVKLKIVENRDIASMRRDFKICTWSYFSVVEYIKLLSRNLIYINQFHFCHIKLIVSLHLSQVN